MIKIKGNFGVQNTQEPNIPTNTSKTHKGKLHTLPQPTSASVRCVYFVFFIDLRRIDIRTPDFNQILIDADVVFFLNIAMHLLLLRPKVNEQPIFVNHKTFT